MKQLAKGDGRVVKIVQKDKLRSGAAYRLSRFVYAMKTPDGAVLKNLLTKQVYALDEGEWTSACAGELSHPAVQELAKLCFLAEADDDELARYNLVVSVLRTLEKKEPGIAGYTILPTTGCNARCVYCYEEGWPVRSMTAETADAVADFICRTKRKGKLRLNWFGGEPLLGAETISRICRVLRERGVEYASGIVTNATLLTPEMAREAVKLWNLKRAQVSMDGARVDYEARKKYVSPALYNYDVAMDAVELLADSGVNVVIRCNYDAENLPRMKDFFADCAARFAGRKNVTVYLAQLFQSTSAEENATLYRAEARAEEALQGLGLASLSRGDKRLRTNYCMADSGGRSVIIDPEGGLHRCEHDISSAPFATVWDETVVFPVSAVKTAAEGESCCFLPECTAFRKNGCPVKVAACRTQMALRTENELTALRKKAETEAGGDEAGDAEAEEECL